MAELDDEPLMDAAELAAFLKRKKSSVYRSTRDGEFDDFVVRIGDKPIYRYSRCGLSEYISRGGRRVMQSGEQRLRSEGVAA